jgi:endonuclease/exonuclease/phosphatase (EEP) superfamily protein YafD
MEIVGWPLLGLLLAARLGWFRRAWLVELADIWQLYVLAPWPCLGLLAARARSPSLGLLAGLGSTLGVVCARTALGRARRPARCDGPRLRMLTANVRGENPSADGLVRLIERERPDVVAVQEIRQQFGMELVGRVGHCLPYFRVQPDERYAGGALLSRWPLNGFERFRLSDSAHLSQRARLNVNGHQVHVFNIHLETPYEVYARPHSWPPFGIRRRVGNAHARQLERLIQQVAFVEEPLIILGDFNVAAGSRPYLELLRRLRDAFGEVGRGLGHTYPQAISLHGLYVPVPVLRIDYVFFKGPLEPLAARPVPQPGSDHRAVVAEFALQCVDFAATGNSFVVPT